MTKPGFVFDSWAVIAFVQDETPASHRVRACLEAAGRNEATIAMSMINVGEVLYCIAKAHSLAKADVVLALLRQLPITLVSADDETILAAARISGIL